DFVKAMPVLGDGEVVCESGPNPYDTRSFHPLYDGKVGFNRQAYERFEHDRDNWNVLGLVNIEEAIVLKKWLKEEAVLWSVGLCFPGSTRHNPTLGPLVFDKESKRRLLNYLERFLRNADADELSPAQWIGYAKANGGYELAQCSMISNPQFVALWDIAESTGSKSSVGDATPPWDEQDAGNVAKDGDLDTHGLVAWQAEALEHWGEISASERVGRKVSPTTVAKWLKNHGSPDVICKVQPERNSLAWMDREGKRHTVKISSIGKRLSEWRDSGIISAR
ncbi:MAG: hypothetical protein Q8J62_07755, partial [Candidatus Cloacimonadaceae bacterium]|nr:hypothetical protein [Candidatus Cloacimonadaceae bacterium]